MVVRRIRDQFAPRDIIVRSSALNEDCDVCSMTGVYQSVKDVKSSSADAVAAALREVIASYGPVHPGGNEILVQPMIENVSMSGVVFSHDLNTGAPYYVVNYDDVSGKTDTVTSGIYGVDRGYVDFGWLGFIDRRHAFFVTRLKTSIKWTRVISHPVDKTLGLRSDQEILLFSAR